MKNGGILKKLIFFSVLFFIGILSSQPKPRAQADSNTPIFIEEHVFPGDSLHVIYLSYRISYADLVFVKEDDHYKVGVNVMFEASDGTKIVDRESSTKSVSTSEYKKTEARNLFVEGVIELEIPSGKISVTPSISDRNSDQSVRLKPIEIEVPKVADLSIINPIPVFEDEIECGNTEYFRLVNFNGVVPFSPNEYYLIVMVRNPDIESIDAVVKQKDEEIFSGSFEKVLDKTFYIGECSDKVVLKENGSANSVGLFIVNGVSKKLAEGPFEIEITAGDEKKSFEMAVEWSNKPISLRNIDFAMDITERILNDPEFEKIYSFDSDLYEEKLFEFWKKKDPVASTEFNELMNEFYLRVDYAIREFSTVNNRNGARSDRGLIYIKFGPPDKIERTYPEQNQIVEIWVYEKIGKEFYFKDTGGLGNYTLMD